MRVRIATPEDEAAVSEVLRGSYPELMRPAYDQALLAAALPLITHAQPRLLASGRFYLAESEEGEPAGCGGWSAEQPGSGICVPGRAHIRHFGTAARFAGRGVGRMLFERCAADAQAAGFAWFECQASLNGEAFYAALGFRRLGPVYVPLGGGGLVFPSVLMERPIPS